MAIESKEATRCDDNPMVPNLYRIQRVQKNTSDTFTLKLKASHSDEEFVFLPGQFNMLYVFGTGEVPISISGNLRKTLDHTTRIVGTVTKAMSGLRRGDTLGVRGPFGSSWPLKEADGRDVVIVAGGIGLAPLRAVLHYFAVRRELHRVVLIYGVRKPEDMLYHNELERLRKRGLQLYLTTNCATADWRGHVGMVTALIPRISFDPLNCIAMTCGPEIMMRFVTQELMKRGVPQESIYLSLERNMQCAIGFCGHCQFGPEFICKDGPVFRYDRIKKWLNIDEL